MPARVSASYDFALKVDRKAEEDDEEGEWTPIQRKEDRQQPIFEAKQEITHEVSLVILQGDHELVLFSAFFLLKDSSALRDFWSFERSAYQKQN